jgi:hypothetical protein
VNLFALIFIASCAMFYWADGLFLYRIAVQGWFEGILHKLGWLAANERGCAAKTFRKHTTVRMQHAKSPPRLAASFTSHPHSFTAAKNFVY